MKKLTDKNRLSIVYPEIAEEWDYEKNIEIIPENISIGSEKIFWWKCKSGHCWKESVFYRTRNKNKSCPICSSLSIVNPKMAKEWHPTKNGELMPSNVVCSSEKMVWWKCECGHEWSAKIKNRTGCPSCSGFIVSDKNRLSVHFPELLKEWDYKKNPVDPSQISFRSSFRAFWKCVKEDSHQWQAAINNRTLRNSTCPYCLNRKVNKTNCIWTTHKHLVGQWHPTKNGKRTPHNTSIGCNDSIVWICDKGHEYSSPPSYKKDHRNINSNRDIGGCPYCNGTKVCEETSLAIINPELAKEWHPTKNGLVTAYNVFPNSSNRYWWICPKKHEWKTTVSSRNNGGTRCPRCRKINLLDGTSWDSYTEAYAYLKFKKRGFVIEPHKKYGMGKSTCDFYLPKYNTYCEITSFFDRKNIFHNKYFHDMYWGRIKRKENFVKNNLCENFRFISIGLLKKQQKIQVTREIKTN